MSKKFPEHNLLDLTGINREMLKEWDEKGVFKQSLKLREGNPPYVFYEGPPSANGMPGIHHVIARPSKIFCRYKTMKGYLVHRKAGWDTHGASRGAGGGKDAGNYQGRYREEGLRGRA